MRQGFAPCSTSGDDGTAWPAGSAPTYTALAVDGDDATLRWTVVNGPEQRLPEEAAGRQEGEPWSQNRACPPSTAAGALDHIAVPEEALNRIAAPRAPSLVISDGAPTAGPATASAWWCFWYTGYGDR